MAKMKYYIFKENGDVEGTNDLETAEAFNDDGASVVIDGEQGKFLGGEDINEAEKPEEDES